MLTDLRAKHPDLLDACARARDLGHPDKGLPRSSNGFARTFA